MSNVSLVVTSFTLGKAPPKNEDMFGHNATSIVVSDGATDKTGQQYEVDAATGMFKTGGEVAARLVVETSMASGLNGSAMASQLTRASQEYYRMHAPNALTDAAYRFNATMVLARIVGDKLVVTQIGDTNFRINGNKQYTNDKEIDRINSNRRKKYVEETGNITGSRDAIMPYLKEQYKHQNQESDPLGYGVIDGSPVPEKFIKVYEFALSEVHTLEIVTDGYFGAFPPTPTIDAYEELHRHIEEFDPHKVGKYASTKATDDRTVVIMAFGR